MKQSVRKLKEIANYFLITIRMWDKMQRMHLEKNAVNIYIYISISAPTSTNICITCVVLINDNHRIRPEPNI